MTCKICSQPLMVSSSRFESEEGTTDVYQVMTLVCINPKCADYSGTDLNNPKTIAETVKNKVN